MSLKLECGGRMHGGKAIEGGFSLIEILVAVLILGIGLLGAAAVQVLSLQNAGNSDYRTQATLLANEAAEIARVDSSIGGLATNRTGDCPNAGNLQDWCATLQRVLPDAEFSIAWDAGNRVLDVNLWWTEREMYQEAGDGENAPPAGVATSTYAYQVRIL